MKLGKLKGGPSSAAGRSHFEAAKADAADARRLCPEYVKAHRRYRSALLALGDAGGAREVAEELRDYDSVIDRMSWNGPVLLATGWVDHFHLMVIYEKKRQYWALTQIRASLGSGRRVVTSSASLVNFQQGQWLMVSVNWITTDGQRRTVEAFSLCATDADNGGDLDEPPHGFASAASLRHAPDFIAKVIAQLLAADLTVYSLMACQGLVEHHAMLQQRLRTLPGAADLLVVPALPAAASQDNGRPFGTR